MGITDQFRLEQRVAVITGGSRGLGREMVLGFADAGADVVIASRKYDACASLASEVSDRFGRRALPVACHVGKWQDCDALFERTVAEFGRADVLVNNAGMSPLYDDVRDVSEELWGKVLGVNLSGPFRLSALFGGYMHENGGGAIVNISSGAALRPSKGIIPYAAAKAGLLALTAGFADAFGPNVRVNAIAAGRFGTDIAKAWDGGEVAADLARWQPMRRVAEPGEIVGTALYLASSASSFTTGAVIRVDGGAPM